MIISSQEYRNYDKVDQKIEELNGKSTVEIPVHYAGEANGEKYYIQIDGHHTLEAAKELGIEVNFVEVESNEWNSDWTLDEALEANWMDSDWRDVQTGKLAF